MAASKSLRVCLLNRPISSDYRACPEKRGGAALPRKSAAFLDSCLDSWTQHGIPGLSSDDRKIGATEKCLDAGTLGIAVTNQGQSLFGDGIRLTFQEGTELVFRLNAIRPYVGSLTWLLANRFKFSVR
ncbi:hypothetical protein Rcae01_04494 [Novipirellula caenicola]|uniref:Uncharacterized protein n=1 Tax=Novipirellula caenicola TaxID=1536901 RepID=A0ABP9VV65_9BACT